MNKNSITTALATFALLLGTGAGISSCADEVDTLDPQASHTAGQLGIVSLSSDGVTLVADPVRTASSRATNDDGTTAATANRAIRSFAANDAVATRYRFIDIATTPAPEASMHTCAATAEGLGTAVSPLLWKMDKRNANNPLAPGKDMSPAETWDEARMEITYAAIGTASTTPTDIVPPTGTDGDAALNRSHMAYRKSDATIGSTPAVVRQYFDALVASNLATATASLPGTKPATLDPGALYIERTKGKEQGAVSANLAHRGALLRLTTDKTSISGFAEGFDRLTVLLAKATIKEGAAGSEQNKEVYIRFSKVNIADGAATEPTRTASAAVWQAIVPDGAVVSQFIATIATADAPIATDPKATYYIALPTATPTLAANTSYPLSLKLTPDTQTLAVGNAPALPGWPNDELEWTNTQNTAYTEDSNTGVRTYTEVKNAKGLKEVIDYINGGTDTNDKLKRMKTNVTLTKDMTYDLAEVYKSAADNSKPAFASISDGYHNSYAGNFNGNGATLAGLYFNATASTTASSLYGLFGAIDLNGKVADLTLKDVNITIALTSQNCYIGSIAGQSKGSVTGCTVTGTLTTTGSTTKYTHLGGMVGQNSGGTIGNCHSACAINSADTYTGGIVGNNSKNTDSNVMGCISSGTVSNSRASKGTICTGGIAGFNAGNVVGCFATGAVSYTGGSNDISIYTGGVVGYSADTNNLYACYTTGTVSSNAGINGSCYGVTYDHNDAEPYTIGAAFWVKPASSPTGSATEAINRVNAAVSIVADIATLNSQAKVDKLNNAIFNWNSSPDTKKCDFRFELGTGENKTPTIKAGAPTEEKLSDTEFSDDRRVRTYTVYTVLGLMEAIDYINGSNHAGKNATNVAPNPVTKYPKTNVNLVAGTVYDLGTVYKASDATSDTKPAYTPIGNSNSAYTGTFDGKGATIKGLYIKASASSTGYSYYGLFGYIGTESKVADIQLTDVNITITPNNDRSCYIGSIAGYNYGGTVTGCTVAGALTTNSNNNDIYLGGVVGNNASTVTGCSSSASVTGIAGYLGGVVGYNYNSGNIIGCYATGNVTCTGSSNSTGGVAGENSNSNIIGCYATGAVSSKATNCYGVTYNFSIAKTAYWVQPNSPTSSATKAINTGGTGTITDVEKLTDIAALNGKVTALNNAITTWNTANNDNLAKKCNYKFVAGTPPTLVVDAP